MSTEMPQWFLDLDMMEEFTHNGKQWLKLSDEVAALVMDCEGEPVSSYDEKNKEGKPN